MPCEILRLLVAYLQFRGIQRLVGKRVLILLFPQPDGTIVLVELSVSSLI